VAREARVSKALIFWHFDNKEKLYRSALRKTLEPYFIDPDEIEGLEEPAQIARLIESFYNFVNDNVYSVRFFMSLMLRSEQQSDEGLSRVNELYQVYRSSFVEVLERGRQRGIFRNDLDAEREASLIMVTLAGVLVQQFMLGEAPERAKEILEFHNTSLFQRLTTGAPGSTAAGRLD
jgi:AcrR family transcriptional regulator